MVGAKGTNELKFSRVLTLCHTRDSSSSVKLPVRRTVAYRHTQKRCHRYTSQVGCIDDVKTY